MKIKLNKSYLYITLGIILFIVIILLQSVSKINKPKINTTPLIIEASPSSTIVPDYNPYEATKEWNDAYQTELNKYINSRNPKADAALSNIRLNSPTVETGFRIEYDYSNSTYTIILSSPYEENRAKTIKWLASQEITTDMLNTLRIKWVNSAP
jgi:hypothetical protein